MRFKSAVVDGYTVYAVAGTNTVSFAIDSQGANTQGLLGFAVQRIDPTENENSYMQGFKVFRSVIPQPDEKTSVSTYTHPVQSFVWDDFTAKPDRAYEYVFHPVKGKPKKLDRTAKGISIKVRTEPLFTNGEHDIFFNRGVAGSQAYARRFENKSPDKQKTKAKQAEALDWLSRDLDDALLRFIDQTAAGDTLLCCFYEFRYRPAADRLKAALGRGVRIRLIVDAKENGFTDKKNKVHESFPRAENLQLIKDAKLNLPAADLIKREARKSDIQHNKFMVLLKGAVQQPTEVWTGSTNLSIGGIHGQTNVGHWVRNVLLAAKYKQYWDILSTDPGAKTNETGAKKKNSDFKTAVEQIHASPANLAAVPAGITPVFSPRSSLAALDLYASMLDDASKLGCMTLAFGINKKFKDALKDNSPLNHLTFLLLEKQDKPTAKSASTFVRINASNNVYQAWGSYINVPLYQWVRETNAGILGLNQHVSYIHSKFLLVDPLGADPVIATGSANFSEASTTDNDENMILIRGSKRAADIYFTEFNRLFNHYYFRSVLEALSHQANPPPNPGDSLFLAEDDQWLAKYAPNKLRSKRVRIFTQMQL